MDCLQDVMVFILAKETSAVFIIKSEDYKYNQCNLFAYIAV